MKKLSQAFELIKNQAMYLTIADGLEDVSRAQTLYDKLERLLTVIHTEQGKSGEGSEQWDILDDLDTEIVKLQNILFDFIKIFEKRHDS